MKKTYFFTAVFFIAINLNAQTFEGKIIYRNNYTSKLAQVKDAQFNAMMGTTQEYFIKGGNYKSVMNGTYSQMQLYIQADNKLYNKLATSDTLYWMDGKKDNDPVVKYEILKHQEEVLGVKCDVIVVESKSGKTTYYFNSKYAVDPSLYKDHKFGNWSFLMEKTKALPLKFIMENAQFKLVSVATEAKEQKLDSNLFKLPSGTPTKASPF
ncbi:MAG: hypothetical protein ACKVOQ_04975 [Cyclobacteriaceae bacterium]